jgi:adenine-specific DNA-methyltransferase
MGTELHSDAFAQCRTTGLDEADLTHVQVRDFVLDAPEERFHAIVANPPYIRHHRISPETKSALQLLAKRLIGKALDGRTGYHVFFFMRALEKLAPGGRLAFILPADTCEGVFARTLWKWALANYRLDAVVTFSHEATPFPRVDTNAMIFMIAAERPAKKFRWCRCEQADTNELRHWVESGFPSINTRALKVVRREVDEGMETGLSRPAQERHNGPLLGDFVRTCRGIASGANEFFFMTKQEALARGLPLKFMVRAVGRTRDVEGDEITEDRLEELDRANRPTFLLSLGDQPVEQLPRALQSYLKEGERLDLHRRSLIKQRHPWYRMETRQAPPFLFAYLGRRNTRFIRNTAGVVPLTGFLCVYSRESESIERTWSLLKHPDTLANLHRVAKSYGSGAIKVEPRALERAPVSQSALREVGLRETNVPRQAEMAFG